MENKKNNKGLIAVIVILSICIVGLVGYIVYDKVLIKEETKENIVSPTTKKEEQTTTQNNEEITTSSEKLQKTTLNYCEKEMCSTKVKDFNFKYYPQRNGMESTLTVNDKELLNDIYFLSDIYVLDETIIVITGSTDIRTTKIYIFDELGNKQKEIYQLDNNYQEMVISDVDDAILITEEGITLKGTRTTHGPSIATYYYDDSLAMEDFYIGRCDIYNKYAEENIYGTYVIKYIGDNKFSEIQNVDYTKLKDSDIRCSN